MKKSIVVIVFYGWSYARYAVPESLLRLPDLHTCRIEELGEYYAKK